MQSIHYRHRLFLPYSAAYVRFQIFDVTLDFVQRLDVTQGLLRKCALVGRMQFKELAPGMGLLQCSA
ncbi:hypothetical protein D3C84_946010 [compost metagenome]